MVLQTSGPISLTDIQNEHGGSDPISLTEYYRNAGYVTSNNTSVPTTGAISMASSFWGTVRIFYFTISSNTQNANIATLATSAGWDGIAPIEATINSSVWLWSDTTATAGLIIPSSVSNGITIINNGNIIGKGGSGGTLSPDGLGSVTATNGNAGGPAIYTEVGAALTIYNNSGAYIAGGGGGGASYYGAGGGGAGGGQGGSGTGFGTYSRAGGAGGSIGSTGSAGEIVLYLSGINTVTYQTAAGAGGGGGQGVQWVSEGNDAGVSFLTGGGGGRILPGTGGIKGSFTHDGISYNDGGSGANGGSASSAGGTSPNNGGGGGGGWGASGGGNGTTSGGSGGAAIVKTGGTISLTNNGTIYGVV